LGGELYAGTGTNIDIGMIGKL